MLTGSSAESPLKKLRQKPATPATMPSGQAGFSTGVNLSPGCDDDGWRIPPPVTLSDGTRLQLYKDGEALRAAYEAIESAKRRVCVEMYIFANDPTGLAFAKLLAKRAREGIRVLVIYDSFGSRGLFGPITEPLRIMKEAGVRLAQFHPLRPWECQFSWRPANRDHRKLIIVDDHIAGLGGLNIGAEYAGSWIDSEAKGQFWRDNGVSVTGPGAIYFLRAFQHTWRYVHRGGRMRRLRYLENLEGDHELGVLASAPTRDSKYLLLVRRLIRNARRSITITIAYFAPDDGLVAQLCAAAKRGVRVRLMFPGVSDVPMVRLAGRGFYQSLLECGVQIYERQHVVLHAKTLCIDGETTVIGSANLDYRSIEYNCELSAVVQSEAFSRHIEELFDNDVQYARHITPADWRRLHWWDKFVQWAVSRIRYVL